MAIKLDRQKLAQFLPTQEAIRAFELLFAAVGDSLPSDLESTRIDAGTAQLQAAEALAGLAQVANALSLSLYGAQRDVIAVDSFVPVFGQEQQDVYVPPNSLGTMADQNAANVSITGGTISVGNLINGNAASLMSSSVALNNGAGALAATITNSPVVGNPTKWVAIRDNGITRYIPTW